MIGNIPKKDTSIARYQIQNSTIGKDVITKSIANISESTNAKESKEKDHPEVSKVNDEHHYIEIDDKEKWHDVPIIPPQIKDKPTTDTVVLLGTDIIETNDMSNEVHNRVDIPVELRKKHDANTCVQKLINEQ